MEKYIKGIRTECSTIKRIRSQLGEKKYRKIFHEILIKFLDDASIVEKVIDTDFLIWECAVLYENKNNIWFQEKCAFLMDQFNRAKRIDKKKVKESLTRWFHDIHDAHVNYSAIFHIQNIDKKIHPRLFVKQGFRQLGDMLEGSFSPYIKQVHDLARITNKEKLKSDSKNATFGQLVADLCKIHEFDDIYKQYLFNVPVSQWRNISQHIDYKFNQSTNRVDCYYGLQRNRKEVSLSLEDFSELISKCNVVYCAHKICLTMFTIKNRSLLNISNLSDFIDDDTLSATILAIFEASGFELLSFSNSELPWKIKVINSFDKSFDELQNVAKKVSMATALREDVTLFIEVQDRNGNVLIQGFTVKQNAQHVNAAESQGGTRVPN